MRLRGSRDRGRRHIFGERGGAAVEAAVVTPVVMALLFGIIEMGFVFKDYLAVSGSVRAGVRVASANPRNATYAQKAADRVALTAGSMNFKNVQKMWVYKANPSTAAQGSQDKPIGFSDFSDCTVCVKFIWDASARKFVKDPTRTEDWPATAQNACVTGPPNRVGVYLQLKHDAFTGLIFRTVNISEGSILTLEPMPVSGGCA